ncbi:MAG: hypothetical protein H6822_20450 [Planctomycetaceae bacterium]|nr:hypothetical protein [Planctomycetales bacterium]MCB9924561.1 hypothetical protein [Planctomycetaceae bacterium]
MPQHPTLNDQLRDHRFAARLQEARLIESYQDDVEQQLDAAKMLMRRIVMERVFDRFTEEQEAKLLGILRPIAEPVVPDENGQKQLF